MLIVTFLVVFAAGAAVGRLWSAPPRHRTSRASWLAQELKLSPEQQKSIELIWAAAMRESRKAQEDRRNTQRKERDEAVQALLTEEQKAQYQQIMSDYDRAREESSTERKTAFDDAVARTKSILTEEQREKYDELMTRFPPGERRSPGQRSFRRERRQPPPEGPPLEVMPK
jgi:Spy/CpxP family protein refolding chaperone